MKPYKRVIFVAESGTCRAPMAVGILRQYSLKREIEVLARGLVVLFPEPLNQKAEAVMISNGISMEGFMSSPLTEADFNEDTLVLTMEETQRQRVLEMFPQAEKENVKVLTDVTEDALEIMDPYGGTLQTYGLCYETLNHTIKKLVNILNEGEE